jgi:hypothetical protein
MGAVKGVGLVTMELRVVKRFKARRWARNVFVLAVVALGLLLGSGSAYAPYLALPDGNSIEVPAGMSYEEAICKAQMQYAEAFQGYPPPVHGSCNAMAFADKEFARIKADGDRSKTKFTAIVLPNGDLYPATTDGGFDGAWCKAYQERPAAFPAANVMSRFGCASSQFDRLERIATKAISGSLGAFIWGGIALLVLGIWALARRLKKGGGEIRTPSQVGFRWMGWWAIVVFFTFITKAYNAGLSFTQFLISYVPPAVFLLLCGYLAGWLYGRFFKFRTQLAVAKDGVDEGVYEAAMKEVDGGDRRAGVWAKAFAESDGDEAKAKAKYIQYRVQQIKTEGPPPAVFRRNQRRVEYVPVPPGVKAVLPNAITAIEYAHQHDMSEKEFGRLIATGRIRSMLHDGVLFVENKIQH